MKSISRLYADQLQGFYLGVDLDSHVVVFHRQPFCIVLCFTHFWLLEYDFSQRGLNLLY